MHATLLTVADPEVGLGHLFRSDALAQALEAERCSCTLSISSSAGSEWLAARAPETAYELTAWNRDLSAARRAVAGSDLVVLDSYTVIDPVWGELEATSPTLGVFDDTGDNVPTKGFVINGSPGASLLDYKLGGNTTYLLGPEYQVLRPPFWNTTERTVPERLESVALMLGGTDNRGLTPRVVALLRDSLPEGVRIYVPGGSVAPAESLNVVELGFLSAREVKALFESVDLLVTAAGQTVAEAAACTLPSIMLETAENQRTNMVGWERTGAAIGAGKAVSARLEERLGETIKSCLTTETRREMSLAAKRLDLTQSTRRLARRLLGR